MSNDWFNIRFGIYHLHIGPDSGISWRLNQYQKDWRDNEPWSWKWFAVYVFFGKHT